MKRVLSALCTLAVAAAFGAGPAWANDEPIEGMPGKILIIKAGKLAKFISKPVSPAVFDLPNVPDNDPTIEGATLSFQELGGDSAAISTDLPAAGWKGLGNPAGSKGFKYKGAGSGSDPCKVVLIKEKIVKAVCKGTGVTLTTPVTAQPAEVAVNLSVGTGTSYCAEFGGTEIKNTSTILKRKDATALPSACSSPSGAFLDTDLLF